MKGLEDVTREIVGLLEAERIEYALMGGVAVRIYALPRPTFDVDFTIACQRGDLPRLYELVLDLGYSISDAQLNGWVDSVRGLPVVKMQCYVGDRAIDVDVFLAETEFQRAILQRRQRHRADRLDAWYVSAEDLILLKLLAGRPKDLVDVGDILFIQGRLDESHLRTWASRLGLTPALDCAVGMLDSPS